MPVPKILVIPGSLRTGSHNARLAALVAKELALAEAEVTRISLADYPMPLLDADLPDAPARRDNAVKLKQMLTAHQGVFITSPEYSASVTPLLKNAIDWMTRVRERDELTYAAFKGRVFAIGSASRRRRRPARAHGAAADSGAGLRRAGHSGTSVGVARRAGVRRHGQSQGEALAAALKRWYEGWPSWQP